MNTTMLEQLRELLREYQTRLTNINPEFLWGSWYANKTISQHEMEKYKARLTTYEQMECFLTDLKKRQDTDYFDKFVEVLDCENGSKTIAKELKEAASRIRSANIAGKSAKRKSVDDDSLESNPSKNLKTAAVNEKPKSEVAAILRPTDVPDPEDLEDLSETDNKKEALMEITFKEVTDKVLKTTHSFKGEFRGRAVIINNQKFSNSEKFPERKGAKFDAINLEAMLKRLKGFDCKVYSDLTQKKMLEKLIKSRDWENHRESQCFLLFVLSHGDDGQVYGTDGKALPIQTILTMFNGENCRALAGKPKLIFIQACRGAKKTAGVEIDGVDDDDDDDDQFLENAIKSVKMEVKKEFGKMNLGNGDATDAGNNVHEMAEIIVAYAAVRGYAAWRNKDLGSYFVRDVVEVFTNKAHKDDLEKMLLEVRGKLHEGGPGNYKALSMVETYMTKPFYLLPSD